MSRVIDRWDRENEEHGDYSMFAGFEAAAGKAVRRFENADEEWDEVGIYSRIAIFGLVCSLLREEARWICPDCRGDGMVVYWAAGVPVGPIIIERHRGAARAFKAYWEATAIGREWVTPWLHPWAREYTRGPIGSLRICRTCGGTGMLDADKREAWKEICESYGGER